jgi:site-specific recombinase XerD
MNHTARDCLQATIKKIEGAYATSTIRAYKSNFADFIEFCEQNKVNSLPSEGETIALFIEKLSRHLRSSSIKIAVAAISSIHRMNGYPDPTQILDVKIAMRRMYRNLGRNSRQAYGINRDILDLMLLSLDDSLRGARDKAILLVAYDSLCRRSELVSLEIEDIYFDHDKTLKLKLRKSKTDPFALGRWLYISHAAQDALKNWLQVSNIKSGKFFRGITKTNKINKQLGPAQISRIYKRIAETSNLNPDIIKNISGHSMRVGAAQDLLLSGASLPEIMNRGRWNKADTIMRYTEHTDLYKANILG